MKYILYYTQSGNTETIANKLGELIDGSTVADIDNFDSSVITNEDTLILGCSAYGAEQLSGEMEDFIDGLNYDWKDKKLGLFGSYDWGDGTWLADWIERMGDLGADVIEDGLKVNIADIDDEDETSEYAKLISSL